MVFIFVYLTTYYIYYLHSMERQYELVTHLENSIKYRGFPS